MAGKRVKAKVSEKLDDNTLKYVIDLLAGAKPITKKEACKILNISYNTTRLTNILQQFHDRVAHTAKMKKRNRGKRASENEVMRVIQEYIEGDPISDISSGMYRSSGFVKSILVENNVPLRGIGTDYFHPELIPDGILTEDYNDGDIVWSARYNTTAVITGSSKGGSANDDGVFNIDKEHGKVYRIWTFGKSCKYAYQPWYELGSLSHLKELGIKLDNG